MVNDYFVQVCGAFGDLVPFVQFKKVKNTHGGVLLLIKLHVFWVFFTFFKLYKWYQIVQSITYYSSTL